MDHNKNIRNMSVIAHVDHVSISRNDVEATTISLDRIRDWTRVGVENPGVCMCIQYGPGWGKVSTRSTWTLCSGKTCFGIYYRRIIATLER